MEKEAQISAVVSEETRDLLEQHVRRTGMKKGRVIEDALRLHLAALAELPADVLVPARVIVTRESGERILERLDSPARPTAALQRLMKQVRVQPRRRR